MSALSEQLKQHILLIDGAMGSLLQARLPRYKGLADELVLRMPAEIAQVHRAYLEAGADCITTCTFNSHGNRHLCLAAAQLARKIADEYTAKTGIPRFVLGDVGPTNDMLSLSPDMNQPALRAIQFDELKEAYRVQIAALIEGGADAILIETATDTLNVKAAIQAYQTACAALVPTQGNAIQLLISFTISDRSGRLLDGQTIEAFVESVLHAQPLAIGINCGYGAQGILPWLRQLHRAVAGRCAISCHPNAGLPNAMGSYDDTPEDMVRMMRPMIEEGIVNIIGGCCGTTPAHIRALHLLRTALQG